MYEEIKNRCHLQQLDRARDFIYNNYKNYLPNELYIPGSSLKLQFIKDVREKFYLGLKDVKDFVENSPHDALYKMWCLGVNFGRKYPQI